MLITCVHQGFELYGSDRSFAECVAVMRRTFPDADIEVILPRKGPITTLLEGICTRIVYEPIWVLRRRNFLRLMTLGLLAMPMALIRALQRFRKSDLVYINTSVIIDYALVARLFPDKSLLHIHEIPEGFARKILRALVTWSAADIIFNSKATRRAFDLANQSKTRVIYNGVDGPAAAEPVTYDGNRPIRVAMLGRISRIKGQEVLIDATEGLPQSLRSKISVRIIGSAFEDEEQQKALADRIERAGLRGTISLEPFTTHTADIYRWSDVIVVPSRLPESLGRVGIEAMSFGRMVIASDIGGLSEVIADGSTGWLVPPGNVAALRDRLAQAIEDPASWHKLCSAARRRYQDLFAEDVVAQIFADALKLKLKIRPSVSSSGEDRHQTIEAAEC